MDRLWAPVPTQCSVLLTLNATTQDYSLLKGTSSSEGYKSARCSTWWRVAFCEKSERSDAVDRPGSSLRSGVIATENWSHMLQT